MLTSNLDADGTRRLSQLLQAVAGDVNAIKVAIGKIIADVGDRARRIYLRNELSRLAKARLRARSGKKPLQEITPAMRHDAPRHEADLIRNIPEHDL